LVPSPLRAFYSFVFYSGRAGMDPITFSWESRRQFASVHYGTLKPCGRCSFLWKADTMAKKAKKRKYSKSSGSDVKNEMRRYKKGKAKSGPGGKGGKVKSRKQAIAIGLSKARKKGKKVPRKKS
jgi:uncharacterized protein DUF6496